VQFITVTSVSMVTQRLHGGTAGIGRFSVVHHRHLPAIRPLTARSAVLSVLLGYHPPELPVSALVKVGALFDIAERTTRVALSRMVADGDLQTRDGVYRLTERLVRRQRQQEDSASPAEKPWKGDWEMAVVTTSARPQAERVALRKDMVDLRLAELREGVWIRPNNLERVINGVVADQCRFFECRYPNPAELVGELWDLAAWSSAADDLFAELAEPRSLKSDFILIAEAVRHLRLDPCLPAELLPDGWPGPALRRRYIEFRDDYAERLRAYSTT
jgi:phenylacetic acid degradation operon negative regulatory protein